MAVISSLDCKRSWYTPPFIAPMESISKKSPKAYHSPMVRKTEDAAENCQQAATPLQPSSFKATRFTNRTEKIWLMMAGEFFEYRILPS